MRQFALAIRALVIGELYAVIRIDDLRDPPAGVVRVRGRHIARIRGLVDVSGRVSCI
jgi:hypothetical protein